MAGKSMRTHALSLEYLGNERGRRNGRQGKRPEAKGQSFSQVCISITADSFALHPRLRHATLGA